MTRREWMRTGNEATFYMSMIAGKAGGLSRELSQVAQIGTQIGESFMFGSGIGIGVALAGTAVSLLAAKIQEEQAAVKAAMEPHDKLAASLAELQKPTSGLARDISEATGASKAFAEQLANIAEASDAGAARIKKIQEAFKAATQAEIDYASAVQSYRVAEHTALYFGDEIASLNTWSQAVDDAKYKAMDLYYAKRQVLAASTEQDIEAVRQTNWLARQHSEWVTQETALQNAAAAYKNLAKNMRDILEGAIGKVMLPTDVTDLDMQATALGHYADKWDETVRRLKTGNIDQYGAEFAARIRELGIPLEDIIRKFQNFSLFAGGKNMGLLNFDALTDMVSEQIDAILGKSEVMEKAFAKVWSNLSEDQRKALEKLGYTKLSDLDKLSIDIIKGPNFNKNMSDIVKTIEDTHPRMGVEIYWIIPPLPGSDDTGGTNGGYGGKGVSDADIRRLANRLGRIYGE